jgi:hypothetical protein
MRGCLFLFCGALYPVRLTEVATVMAHVSQSRASQLRNSLIMGWDSLLLLLFCWRFIPSTVDCGPGGHGAWYFDDTCATGLLQLLV